MTVIAHPRGAEIATTMKRQIGLDAWLAVSARNPRWWTNDDGNVVFAFRFGSRYGLAKWCEITYRPGSDDYAMTAYRIRRNGCKSVLSIPDEYEPSGRDTADWDGLYADSLGIFVRSANEIGEFA